MIKRYNEYIKEENTYINNIYVSDDKFAAEIYKLVNDIIPEKTNLEINYNDDNDITIIFNRDNNLYNADVISLYYYDKNYIYQDDINDDWDEKTTDIEKFKKLIIKNFNNFYFKYEKCCNISLLCAIPVINNYYSNFIYKLLMKDITLLSQINDIKKYLNDETLDKLQHLINAKNFNLI